MPRRSIRVNRRTTHLLSALIALTALAAVGLILAIALSGRFNPPEQEKPTVQTDGDFVDLNDLPKTEIVLKADTYNEDYLPTPSPEPGAPTPTPTNSPTPAPTRDLSDPYAALRPAPAGMDMLPIFKKAYTDKKVIAITLDECSGATITEQFIGLAARYNAKLTLFPTGENAMKNGMDVVLKKCVFQLGHEVENRGYSAFAKLFQCPETLMVQEVWKQEMALNYALGVRYRPHFFRMYGGLGENDRRSHAYLMQQGYLGVARWLISGTDTPAYRMPSKLTPGGIYNFKTIPDDGERMEALMKAARDEGYQMVTLNELFGYPANTYTQDQGSLLSETMPEFDYDDTALYDLYPGDAAWAVYRMQARLGELGYIVGSEPDGIFGEGTTEGLRRFQATVGRPASGAGDVGTLKLLFSNDAPYNPNPIVIATPTPKPGQLIEENPLLPSEDLEQFLQDTGLETAVSQEDG